MLSGLRRPITKQLLTTRSFKSSTSLMQKDWNNLDIQDYDYAVNSMRKFFKSRGWKEVNTQYRRSILAACEDPWTIAHYDFEGERWPLPQTGQMWLEYDLLRNPFVKGVFTISTSYRQEPKPIYGRHQTIFPMFEFEGRGDLVDLRKMETELLEYLGFGQRKPFKHISYYKACNDYEVEDIEADQESKLCIDYGSVVFLERFPKRTNPFWNMYLQPGARETLVNGETVWEKEEHVRKIDVIIHGQETIGSAERETNPELMRKYFETISDGAYAKKIRDLFGEDRVNAELEDFLSLNFVQRYGGGIGIHRMIRGMELEGLLPVKSPMYKDFSVV